VLTALFEDLTRAVGGSPAVALAAAALWGVASILLSPCHLASIPLVVGFIGGQGPMPTRRAAGLAAMFALGILTTIAIIGAATAAAGRIAGDVGAWGNWLVAVVFFAVGLHLLDVIALPLSPRGPAATVRRGALAALVLGLLFGVALGPCTFAFMAPMLAVTFRVAADSPAYGIVLLLAYGVGHTALIVLAGAGTEWVQRYLDWSERSRATRLLRHVCGVLVLAAGLYMIFTAP